MPKRSRRAVIAGHVAELREKVKNRAEDLRLQTLRCLKEVFNLTSELAGGEIKTQTEGGKTQRVTIGERKMWLHVASKIAHTIEIVSSGFDEKKINMKLEELEGLVDKVRREVKKKEIEN